MHFCKMVRMPKLAKIWKVLPEARLVGGCVRDSIIGIPPKDFDFAIPICPEEASKKFKDAGYTVLETGLQHGTITVMVENEGFELTTLRTDDKTDGRHATVSWITDWKADSTRRDFTINSMYIDCYGNLYDYHNGVEDIKNKVIRFVGDADKRIKEDALRILRYFRFMGRFESFSMDDETSHAIRSNISMINLLSSERIYSELTKIFSNKNAYKVIANMNNIGLSKELFRKDIPLPKFDIDFADPYTIFASIQGNKIDMLRDYNASNNDISIVNEISKLGKIKFKISDLELKKLLLTNSRLSIICKGKLDSYNKDFFVEDYDNFVEIVSWIDIPEFPIMGRDLIEENITPGPKMGIILKNLKDSWIKSNFEKDKDQLLGEIIHELREVQNSN